MKFFFGIVLSWSITISVLISFWGKSAIINHVNSSSQVAQNIKFSEMSAKYELMILAYKKMCVIKETYDEEVVHLMQQIEIHQRNMQEKAKSRSILAEALRQRGIEFGIGGSFDKLRNGKNRGTKRKKKASKRKKVVAGIVKRPKK